MNVEKKTTKLIKNTTIYFIGTIICKIMNIIFLPIITIYLTTAEYGYYDLIITTISLLLPIFTLQSIDAVFRFLFNADEEQKKSVLSNVWVIVVVGNILFVFMGIFLNHFFFNIEYVYLVIGYYVINVFIGMYQRIARSYGHNIVFSISGIIQAGIMIVLELCMLCLFKMKVDGMLLSYIISGIITCIYLEFKVCIRKSIHFNLVNKKEIKEVIRFSMPLIPNSICWWATASINKYIILLYIGQSANGLYAVTLKFASVITMVSSVFNLAWQESTIMEYGSEDNEIFFSFIFEKYLTILILSTCIAILGLKLCYGFLVSPEYFESWIYVPVTMLGTAFTAISSFYGTGYLAAKRTGGALWSTIISAVINIIVCIILVRKIGVMSAPVASAVAYLGLWLFRHFTMKSFYKIILNKKLIILLSGIFIIVSYIYYNFNFTLNFCSILILVSIFVKYVYKEVRVLLKNKLDKMKLMQS